MKSAKLESTVISASLVIMQSIFSINRQFGVEGLIKWATIFSHFFY